MPKITVKDADKDFHTFKGNDLKFFYKDRGVEIVRFVEKDGDRQAKTIAAFAAIIWVKEDERDEQPASAPAPIHDLLERAPPAPRVDSDPFTAAAQAQRDPDDKVDFAVLSRQEPEKPSAAALVQAKYIRDGVASMDADAAIAWMRGLTDEERQAMAMVAQRRIDVEAATKAGKAIEETGPQLLDQLTAAGTVSKGMPAKDYNARRRAKRAAARAAKQQGLDHLEGQPVAVVAPSPFEQAIDQAIAEMPQPANADDAIPELGLQSPADDPDAAIREAEARHAERLATPAKHCDTCQGTGIVRDPDSADPLDTMICPTC